MNGTRKHVQLENEKENDGMEKVAKYTIPTTSANSIT